MTDRDRTHRPRPVLGLSAGQWQTILLALILAAALLAATLPPVLDAHDGARQRSDAAAGPNPAELRTLCPEGDR
ncbi:hypothetical protein [Dactylosporangium sp. CA-233914]|uniref:hypothetical protein n=1 Tax=Dactylosporangium sp. CA-233914 TaxID=3239934 RepID=UPI003D8E0BF2